MRVSFPTLLFFSFLIALSLGSFAAGRKLHAGGLKMFPGRAPQVQLRSNASLDDALIIPKKSKDNDFLRALLLRPRRLSPSPEASLRLAEAKPFGLEDPRPFEFCPRCPSRDIFHPPL